MKKETAKNIIHIEYHENGQVKHEVKFEDFNIQAKDTWMNEFRWKQTWWFDNGQIEKVVNYVNDKRDGKWFAWYWHGQIKTEVNHKNGNLEGRQTEYFENGQIDMEGIFKDGNYLRNGRRSGSQLQPRI